MGGGRPDHWPRQYLTANASYPSFLFTIHTNELEMKLLSVAILSFLSSSALAARKGVPSDGFIKFHTEQLSAPGALKLDQESYDELINGPRNYSSVVLLTAQAAQFSCQLCKDFQPEWDLLARSWVKGDRAGESRVVFGTLDFFDGKLAFQKLQLQTVPILVVYPPTIGEYASKASDPYKWAFTDGYVLVRSCSQTTPLAERVWNTVLQTAIKSTDGFLDISRVTYPGRKYNDPSTTPSLSSS